MRSCCCITVVRHRRPAARPRPLPQTQMDKTWRAGESVELANVEKKETQFTYAEGDEVSSEAARDGAEEAPGGVVSTAAASCLCARSSTCCPCPSPVRVHGHGVVRGDAHRQGRGLGQVSKRRGRSCAAGCRAPHPAVPTTCPSPLPYSPPLPRAQQVPQGGHDGGRAPLERQGDQRGAAQHGGAGDCGDRPGSQGQHGGECATGALLLLLCALARCLAGWLAGSLLGWTEVCRAADGRPCTLPCRHPQSGGSKPATLETGAVVQVPLFIQQGERIKVDTRSDSYVARAN